MFAARKDLEIYVDDFNPIIVRTPSYRNNVDEGGVRFFDSWSNILLLHHAPAVFSRLGPTAGSLWRLESEVPTFA